ncbi:hypothetical protein [Anaerovibrio sp. RM50]|nr:hypothetical protein [Anaerovibrio sp. RM50]
MFGGGMTCEKRLVNGPKRVHRKREYVIRLERLPPLLGCGIGHGSRT